jgi:glutamate synthase (NADPH/NADH) large chain
MTGGVAYAIDVRQLNADSVVMREVPSEDMDELLALIEEHHRRTGSPLAAQMLASWDEARCRFRQIVPVAAVAPAPAPTAVAEHKVPKTAV